MVHKGRYQSVWVDVQTDVLHKALRRKGWNVTKWALESGVSRPTAQRFFSGKEINISLAWRLLRALGISPDWAFEPTHISKVSPPIQPPEDDRVVES